MAHNFCMSWNFLCDLILPIDMFVLSLSKIWAFWKFDPWTSYAKKAKYQNAQILLKLGINMSIG